jgi:cyclase
MVLGYMSFNKGGEGVTMEKIGEGIYVETKFLGCNPSFVVTTDGIVMIDTPQKPEEAFQWRKEIQKHGKVAYIINTDHHGDHVIGNYYFSAETIMHEGTMKKLSAPEYVEFFKNWVKLLDPQWGPIMDHYFVRKPKLTYTNRMTLHMGEDIFELIHVRSHTEDETLIYMPQRGVLFAGDTVCTNGIPSLYESYPLEWLGALQLIEELDFEVLVPGHGKVGNKDSMRQFRKELKALIDRAQDLINHGLDRKRIIEDLRYEDVVHSKYPASVTAHFQQNMGRNIGRLYDALIKK